MRVFLLRIIIEMERGRVLVMFTLLVLSLGAPMRNLQSMVVSTKPLTAPAPTPSNPPASAQLMDYETNYDQIEDSVVQMDKEIKGDMIAVINGNGSACLDINAKQPQMLSLSTLFHLVEKTRANDPNINQLANILYTLSSLISYLSLENEKTIVKKALALCSLKVGQLDDQPTSPLQDIIDTYSKSSVSFEFYLETEIAYLIRFRTQFEGFLAMETANQASRVKGEAIAFPYIISVMGKIKGFFTYFVSHLSSFQASAFAPLNPSQKAYLASFTTNITKQITMSVMWVEKQVAGMNLTPAETQELGVLMADVKAAKGTIQQLLASLFGVSTSSIDKQVKTIVKIVQSPPKSSSVLASPPTQTAKAA